jgi:para-aminobenzoate synthetase/4-amino-4-deoxychorismate lyase
MDSETDLRFPRAPFVLLESFSGKAKTWRYLFEDPLETVSARAPEEVPEAVGRIEENVSRGLHAAGCIAYEAASVFDPAMKTRSPSDLPLLWFGIFRERKTIRPGTLSAGGSHGISRWTPSMSREHYAGAFRRIQDHITAGDTYQVNFTFRLKGTWEGDPFHLYRRVCRSQRAPFCAFIDMGRHKIVSASPELFFDRRDGFLTCRPMKGTHPRGRWLEEDEEFARRLYDSPKERSENVMIVDLLRNDMGRVSEHGSVVTERLFDVERYETVLQMTSTIHSQVRAGVGFRDLLTALFPCGSVTGAPKIRTMEIISELEDSPRGIYTGAIGYLSPGPEAMFNVAIRTLLLNEKSKIAELGVGGGITHYSEADLEYDECLTKARFLLEDRPEFDVFETILWEGREFFLLERHLDRMERSAQYFNYPCDREVVRKALDEAVARLSGERGRVRLLLSHDGSVRYEESPLAVPNPGKPYLVALARKPVDSRNPFLYHKTTHRRVYEAAAAARPDCDDVILWNERGEITESTIANVVLVIDGTRWTPPVECGLLPGVYREELLHQGRLRERVLSRGDLDRAETVYLINSVRREWRVRVVS